MKRKLIVPLLALTLFASCAAGCAKGDGSDAGGQILFGRGVPYVRAASDEEAFSRPSQQSMEGSLTDIDIPDQSVPMAELPAAGPEDSDLDVEAAEGEGWLLVHYTHASDGLLPLDVKVWSENQGWQPGAQWSEFVWATAEADSNAGSRESGN